MHLCHRDANFLRERGAQLDLGDMPLMRPSLEDIASRRIRSYFAAAGWSSDFIREEACGAVRGPQDVAALLRVQGQISEAGGSQPPSHFCEDRERMRKGLVTMHRDLIIIIIIIIMIMMIIIIIIL